LSPDNRDDPNTREANGPVPLARIALRPRRVKLQVMVGMHTNTNFFTGATLDISEGGLFVATPAMVPLGLEVDLDFTLPDGKRVVLTGVVRWRREHDERMPDRMPGVGVQFVTVSEEVLASIRAFMAKREPLLAPQ
jgi:uncharacterized protein (TIGR02266 family)